MSNFVHLHVHTQYSLLDGAAELESLMKKASEYRMPALGITDHGVMYGCLKFYQLAKKYNIKPIIGCEVYLAPRKLTDKTPKVDDNYYHLVLLAENNQGYQNLLRLVSIAHLEGFYYKPRIDLDVLRQYSRGLIGLSACLHGEIPSLILNNQLELAAQKLSIYQDIFGPNNFFLELQYQQLAQQRNVNRELLRLSRQYHVPVVATNDVHYINKEDALVHDVLLCIQTGKTIDEPERLKFPTAEFYLKTAAEMEELFFDCPEALQNTIAISERCDVSLELNKIIMPSFETPPAMTSDEYLERLCREGITRRDIKWDSSYEARLAYELKTIKDMGFSGYFLVVNDFVSFAKQNRIMVGPGRGSAAGSLVAYLLGITDLDPLEYGLLFERFLNPERVSMPDIDIDFCYERRNEVINYVRKRFGSKQVAQIITFGTMAAKAAIRDVGRALGMSYGEVDRVAKLIPGELGISIREALDQSPDLRQLASSNRQIENLLNLASKVEGFPRHASTHAAGVVIAKEELTNYLPLALSNEAEIITQYPMEDIEALGLLKMDFLGLRTLTVIRDTIRLIEANRGETVDLTKIPTNDQLTFAMLQKGHTLGVFQLESRGIRNLLVRLKPENIADLIALMALYRPGPLGSGMVDDFIMGRHGLKQITYLHPSLEPILAETYGVILYQEQVMRIASDLGGFTLGEADLVRRAMAKKKPETLAALREKFINGSKARGIPEAKAVEIFELMEYFSGYGFNKSHSAAYAVVVYQTAYLKSNYPQEYLAALLTSMMGNPDKIGLYVEECRRLNIKILHPDINRSQASFVPEGDNIRFGLMGIKNLGIGAIEKIISEREQNGEYHSLRDFCSRNNQQLINRRVIESLIRAGAFDSLGVGRRNLLTKLDSILEQFHRSPANRNQLNLLDLFVEADEPDVPDASLPEFTAREILEQEREYLGVYLSGHPLDEWIQKFNENGIKPLAELDEEAEGKEILVGGLVIGWRSLITKNGEPMATFVLEDLTGMIEVVVFPRLYEKVGAGYSPERVVIIKGRVQEEERGKKILATQLRWL